MAERCGRGATPQPPMSATEVSELLAVAIKSTEAAGAIVLRYFRTPLDVAAGNARLHEQALALMRGQSI